MRNEIVPDERPAGALRRRLLVGGLALSLLVALAPGAAAHPHPSHAASSPAAPAAATTTAAPAAAAARTAGQGKYLFRHVPELGGLPEAARQQLHLAHGGFAVDPRTGEVFFGLKGAGVIWMNDDLTDKKVLPVNDPKLLEGNFHNTALFYNAAGKRFLALPDNEKGRVFILDDLGALVATLNAPRELNEYYGRGGSFNPTDTQYAAERLYVTDGYSPGNYILTADPWTARWLPLVFGGRASRREYGLFGTAHGVVLNPATRRLEIADRANSRIQSFDLNGTFLGCTKLPEGSLPCDVDIYQGQWLVGCLQGPGGKTPAPFYVLDQDGQVVSEINPLRDFGLERYTHIHNAAWKPVRGQDGKPGKVYVLTTAWNPGDFAVFEWVK